MEMKLLKRNEHGLLEGVNYIFNESGAVNWRAMISPEYIVLNKQKAEQIEKTYQKSFHELSTAEVDDKFLLILLGGFKELARLRGFNWVSYNIHAANEVFVSATCNIGWIANFETEGREISFQDGADATNGNTTGFGKSFLTTICINRSFVRNVRNFLGINVLGQDEISDSIVAADDEVAGYAPKHLLLNRMREKGVTFGQLQAVCAKDNPEAKNWESVDDIPIIQVLALIERLNKKKKKE